MNFRHLVFNQFLEDEEQINKAFREPFPIGGIFFWIILIVGIAYGSAWLFAKNDLELQIMIYVGVAILGFIQLLRIYLKWYTRAILMTTENLLFVDWEKMFAPWSNTLDYWDLDKIIIERTGLASYTGNYGNLHFKRINGADDIIIKKIYRPHFVEKTICAFRGEQLDNKNFTEEAALKDLLSQMVQTHTRNNGQPARENEIPEKSREKPQKERFESDIEFEKELDDEGGIEIDL